MSVCLPPNIHSILGEEDRKDIPNNILETEQQFFGRGVKKLKENSEIVKTREKVEELQIIILWKYIESLYDKKEQAGKEKASMYVYMMLCRDKIRNEVMIWGE